MSDDITGLPAWASALIADIRAKRDEYHQELEAACERERNAPHGERDMREHAQELAVRLERAEAERDAAREEARRANAIAVQQFERTKEAKLEAARLREALRDTLAPDKNGVLHEPGCIGLYGYDCKAWCVSTRAALSTTPPKETE